MSRSPLEAFVCDYVETIGGAWEEIEPQVYDVLLPRREGPRVWEAETACLTFDPEAVPEHPGCQLASYGTPLVEGFLEDAVARGRFSELYFLGLNLNPHDLPGRLRKALHLAEGVTLRTDRVRAMHFPQAVFSFQASFVSDQKEQEILAVSLDLHYGRQVRHRDRLMDFSRLAEEPALPLPEAPALSLAAAYPTAREEALRTLIPLTHARDRELRERLGRQEERMQRYYADMRRELSGTRSRDSEDAQARIAARQQTIEREERLRIAELRQKNSLRVELRLLGTLVIHQPKLLIRGELSAPKRPTVVLDLVWDPLLDALEAVPCPLCHKPTFGFGITRTGSTGSTACDACLEAGSKG